MNKIRKNHPIWLWKSLTIVLCSYLFFISACTKQTTDPAKKENDHNEVKSDTRFKLKNTTIASGIYYHGRIYWEITQQDNQEIQVEQGINIGSLQNCADEFYFPTADFTGTSDLKSYIGTDIYQLDTKLYMDGEDGVRVFWYVDEMDLGTEMKEPPSDGSDGTPSPHFVYKDMVYCIYDELDNDLPSYFVNVGETSEEYFIANKNFTGSIASGSELYATSFQNRYMIQRRSGSGTYVVHENEGYRSQ